MVELNSCMKSRDIQSGPGMATICSSDGGSEEGISEACGYNEKKDEMLFLDKWSAATYIATACYCMCSHIICKS